MRIVFFGSGAFAVPCLEALSGSGQNIALVVTQPDRRAGRGGHLRKTPVKETAEALGLPVYQPQTLREEEVRIRLEAEAPDLCTIVAYGKKVPPELLTIPPHGFLNAHASILPQYRGAAPVPHAIWHGEEQTGVTVFRLEPDWDSGPVFGYVRTPIRSNDTSESVLARLAPMAGNLLAQVAADIEAGSAQPVPQEHAEATRAPKLTREDGRIDWAQSPERIDRMVRAFQPWPEAFTTIAGKRGRRQRVQVLGVEREPARDGAASTATPGEVLVADAREGLVVSVGAGESLRLTRVKPEGKREMSGAEFVRGARLGPGDRLGEDVAG
jgi:methionyl-tRNA formyltransferase